jgi:hypothetical protein
VPVQLARRQRPPGLCLFGPRGGGCARRGRSARVRRRFVGNAPRDAAPTDGRALSLPSCRTRARVRPEIRSVEPKRDIDPARIPLPVLRRDPSLGGIIRRLEDIHGTAGRRRHGMLVQLLRAGVHDAERVVAEGEGVRPERVPERVCRRGEVVRHGTEAEFAWRAEGEGDDRCAWSEICRASKA